MKPSSYYGFALLSALHALVSPVIDVADPDEVCVPKTASMQVKLHGDTHG